jgi:hypothetical protein
MTDIGSQYRLAADFPMAGVPIYLSVGAKTLVPRRPGLWWLKSYSVAFSPLDRVSTMVMLLSSIASQDPLEMVPKLIGIVFELFEVLLRGFGHGLNGDILDSSFGIADGL